MSLIDEVIRTINLPESLSEKRFQELCTERKVDRANCSLEELRSLAASLLQEVLVELKEEKKCGP
ncbi:MAG: hypothetical protein COT74_04340 [Bdellovibrionales bacterium CG10_big_fil_rev_8_21_14_0_10_45_34]|nr:MAG: hypothetical protein COT74_04340 [Bdellovibrionales bacterium CG10_big_fil_rev_8_21_14_0_10_45_34]